MNANSKIVTVRIVVNAPIDVVWSRWTSPSDMLIWNCASDDWHTTRADNNLRPDGRFCYRMEAKSGLVGFDFSGKYTAVVPKEQLAFLLDDGRSVSILFWKQGGSTEIVETFETENTHPIEMQRDGWLSILVRFKNYCESFSTT